MKVFIDTNVILEYTMERERAEIVDKLFDILQQVLDLFLLPSVASLEGWYYKMMFSIQQIRDGHWSKVLFVGLILRHSISFVSIVIHHLSPKTFSKYTQALL